MYHIAKVIDTTIQYIHLDNRKKVLNYSKEFYTEILTIIVTHIPNMMDQFNLKLRQDVSEY